MRRQRRIPGGRERASTGLERAVEQAVRAEMRRWGVSRSFVLATAAAFALNVKIDEQDDYRRRPRLEAEARGLHLVKRRAG